MGGIGSAPLARRRPPRTRPALASDEPRTRIVVASRAPRTQGSHPPKARPFCPPSDQSGRRLCRPLLDTHRDNLLARRFLSSGCVRPFLSSQLARSTRYSEDNCAKLKSGSHGGTTRRPLFAHRQAHQAWLGSTVWPGTSTVEGSTPPAPAVWRVRRLTPRLSPLARATSRTCGRAVGRFG